MSLFRGTIRPPAILSDEAVERYLAAIRAELAPDPLFRRRLRGEVMNRYVAAREGMVANPRSRSMGKLGRAVLYASFTLALSGTSVLAASQQALPGDLLYPLKRQVETLRMEVLPAHLHHDLAAYELAERIDELARLTQLGDVSRAAALAAVVAEDYEAFLAEADAAGDVSDDRYLTVLTALLDRLPEPAQEAIQAVIDRAPSHGGPSPTGGQPSVPSKGNASTGSGAGAPLEPGNANGPADGGSAEATPKPTKSPKPAPEPPEPPEPTPRASRQAFPAGGGGGGGGGQPDADEDHQDGEEQGDQ